MNKYVHLITNKKHSTSGHANEKHSVAVEFCFVSQGIVVFFPIENICKLCIGRFKCGEEDVDLKRRWKMERRWKMRLFKITHLIFFQGVERFGD